MEEYLKMLMIGSSMGIIAGMAIIYGTNKFLEPRYKAIYDLPKKPRESPSDLENNLSDDPEILNRK